MRKKREMGETGFRSQENTKDLGVEEMRAIRDEGVFRQKETGENGKKQTGHYEVNDQ